MPHRDDYSPEGRRMDSQKQLWFRDRCRQRRSQRPGRRRDPYMQGLRRDRDTLCTPLRGREQHSRGKLGTRYKLRGRLQGQQAEQYRRRSHCEPCNRRSRRNGRTCSGSRRCYSSQKEKVNNQAFRSDRLKGRSDFCILQSYVFFKQMIKIRRLRRTSADAEAANILTNMIEEEDSQQRHRNGEVRQ